MARQQQPALRNPDGLCGAGIRAGIQGGLAPRKWIGRLAGKYKPARTRTRMLDVPEESDSDDEFPVPDPGTFLGGQTDSWPTDFDEFDDELQSTKDRVEKAVEVTLVAMSAMWFMLLLWVLTSNAFATWFHVREFAQTHTVGVVWPDLRFHPQRLACVAGRTYVANEFSIYELQSKTPATQVACNVSSTIVDITAVCNEDDTACRPLVLVNSTSPDGHPEVVDCASGVAQPLLRVTTPAKHLSVDETGSKLVALHEDNKLVFYRRSADAAAWEPQWDLGAMSSRVVSLHLAGDRLAIFQSYPRRSLFNKALQVMELGTSQLINAWTLPSSVAQITAACANDEDDSALVLPAAEEHAASRPLLKFKE